MLPSLPVFLWIPVSSFQCCFFWWGKAVLLGVVLSCSPSAALNPSFLGGDKQQGFQDALHFLGEFLRKLPVRFGHFEGWEDSECFPVSIEEGCKLEI